MVYQQRQALNPSVQKLLLCIDGIWLNQEPTPAPLDPQAKLGALRRKLWKKLHGFSPELPPGSDSWSRRGSREGLEQDLPVPALVLFALHRILGFPQLDPGDKGRWAVGCMVDGEPVIFRDRKFGFEILFAKGSKLTSNRVVRPIKAALRVLEDDFLMPLATEQIHEGQVGLVNRFGEFTARYRYFRDKADELFAQAEARPAAASGQESSSS